MSQLTHFDETGASRMVDVGDKGVTQRVAVAEATVRMQAETLRKIQDKAFAKGDVLEVARLAGIMGAKQTSHLIPLCHPLPLEGVMIGFEVTSERTIQITATVKVTAKTGVEMEALTAVTTAALTVYDMCKAIDRRMEITDVLLVSKSGGKSGDFIRTT